MELRQPKKANLVLRLLKKRFMKLLRLPKRLEKKFGKISREFLTGIDTATKLRKRMLRLVLQMRPRLIKPRRGKKWGARRLVCVLGAGEILYTTVNIMQIGIL
jgi:hypothetical protein